MHAHSNSETVRLLAAAAGLTPSLLDGMQTFEPISVTNVSPRADSGFTARFGVGSFAMVEISQRTRVLCIISAVKFFHNKVRYDVLTIDDLHAHDLDSDRLHRITTHESETIATFERLSYLRTQLQSL